jgi:acyl carrier protein
VAPRTPTEQHLARLWADLLRVEQVGLHDNFFELGGHSLLATQVISQVRETLRIELSLRSLFETPTLAQFAEQIEAVRRAEQGNIEKVARILEKVQQMSDDEVRTMLARKKSGRGINK